MLTLSIVRHAKSSWGDPSLRDIERPLNTRGKAQAQRMGAYLSEIDNKPDLIICSRAKRARQTLKQLQKNWSTDAKVVVEKQLYLASTNTITALLEEYGEDHTHIMIIGHNPGLHMLAAELVERGDPAMLQILAEKFPTSTVCVIRSQADRWGEIEYETGELLFFATPKILATNP